MNGTLFYPELIKALGWTLLHSLWQGLLIFAILWAILATIRHKSPQFRYLLSLAGLVTLLLWMAGTFTSYLPQLVPASPIVTQQLMEANEVDLLDVPVVPTAILPIGNASSWEQNLGQMEQTLSALIDRHAPLLVKIWLMGVLLFAFRWLASVYYTYRLRSIQTSVLPKKWQEEVQNLATVLGITKSVRLLESAKVDVPMIIGHLQPVILIPVGALTGLTPEQIRAILMHELAHIRRYDFLINMVLSGLEVILFYHPAFWWIANIIRQEREKCCDDIAIEVCGNAKFYARTLLIMEEKRQQRSLAMAFQGNKNQLLHRIKRICLVPQQNQRNDISKVGLMLGLLLSFGAWAWASLPTTFEEVVEIVLEEEAENCEPVAVQEALLTEPQEEALVTEKAVEEQPVEADYPADKKQETVLVTTANNKTLPLFLSIDTVPYPKLSELKLPALESFPEFDYSFEQLQAEHEKGTPYKTLINPYKEKIDAWSASYSDNFLKHWQARQNEIHQAYQQWVKNVKSANQGDELGAAIELYRSRVFEKALSSQEKEMSHSEKEVSRNVEKKIKDIERALQSMERKKEDREARQAIHDDRMAMHDLRMSVHDIRMHMHDARMSVHDTRMAMHDDRMAAHDIVMTAFKKELFAALIQDGFIKNKEDDVDLMVKNGKVEINGKNLSEEQSEKYLKMIEDYGFQVREDKTWGIKMNKRGTSIGTFTTTKKEE